MAINGKQNPREGVYRTAIDMQHGDTEVIAQADDYYRAALIGLVLWSTEATTITLESYVDDPEATTPLTGGIEFDGALSWHIAEGFCASDRGAALRITSTGGAGALTGFAVYAKER
jgi:hypothetical protein